MSYASNHGEEKLYIIPVWGKDMGDIIQIKCPEGTKIEVYFPDSYRAITEKELAEKGVSLSKYLRKRTDLSKYVNK